MISSVPFTDGYSVKQNTKEVHVMSRLYAFDAFHLANEQDPLEDISFVDTRGMFSKIMCKSSIYHDLIWC
jgi:hypothetical protein